MKSHEYTTGTGQTLTNVHTAATDCYKFGCVIHNPTDPNEGKFPTHWRSDRGLMERICSHDVGHPDRDHIEFTRRARGNEAAYYEALHGCDGCCGRTEGV